MVEFATDRIRRRSGPVVIDGCVDVGEGDTSWMLAEGGNDNIPQANRIGPDHSVDGVLFVRRHLALRNAQDRPANRSLHLASTKGMDPARDGESTPSARPAWV